jgi:hypothetical protein
MATSHGVQQGYNANAVVDSKKQIVTNAEVFGSGTDSKNMAPMLKGAKENLEAIGWKKPLASLWQYTILQENGPVYINKHL